MTRASTLDAVDRIERPKLWGIGQYESAGALVDFGVSWDDVDRDAAWATRVLATFGIGRGAVVVVVSGAWEAPWFAPVRRAVRALDAAYAPAEIWAWDLRRVATFVRRLPVAGVVGLTSEQTEALGEHPGLAEDLSSLPLLLARPESRVGLQGLGASPGAVAMLGPALGLSCSAGGTHVDADEWTLTPRADGIVLSTAGARTHQVAGLLLERVDRVVPGSCPCGVHGPRIVVS